jgi:putative nucleotidyltransferase with HDIG domain
MSPGTNANEMPARVAALFADAEESEAHGRWRVAREQYELALRVGCRPVDIRVRARAVRRIARCLVEEGEMDSALDALVLARTIAEQGGDASGVAHAINLEGIVAQQTGELALAEQRYRAARTLAWEERDTLLVAMLDQNLGTIANIRGDLVEAKLRYEGSLTGYRALYMSQPVGPLHNNLGMLHTDLRQWREAEWHFTEALRFSSMCGDIGGQLRTQANRAEMYVARRHFRKAKQLGRRVLSLALAPDACDGSWLAEAYKHLGVAHRETGDLTEAERYLNTSLTLAEQRHDALLTAEILREVAVLCQLESRHQDTLAALTRAHALFAKLAARPDLTEVDRKLRDLERQFLEIVQHWGESIETADSYTQGHCLRVAELATLLAKDAGLEPGSLLWFRMGALLHDVGKLVVPIEVLNKRGALSPKEEELMRLHPVAGQLLVADAHFPWDVGSMIRHHHERWDGTGYPDGLCGEAIPLTARILCIADVYDALTSTRSYREAHGPEIALAIMSAESGQAFDPALLHTFFVRTQPSLLPHRTPGAHKPLVMPAYHPELELLSA